MQIRLIVNAEEKLVVPNSSGQFIERYAYYIQEASKIVAVNTIDAFYVLQKWIDEDKEISPFFKMDIVKFGKKLIGENSITPVEFVKFTSSLFQFSDPYDLNILSSHFLIKKNLNPTIPAIKEESKLERTEERKAQHLPESKDKNAVPGKLPKTTSPKTAPEKLTKKDAKKAPEKSTKKDTIKFLKRRLTEETKHSHLHRKISFFEQHLVERDKTLKSCLMVINSAFSVIFQNACKKTFLSDAKDQIQQYKFGSPHSLQLRNLPPSYINHPFLEKTQEGLRAMYLKKLEAHFEEKAKMGSGRKQSLR